MSFLDALYYGSTIEQWALFLLSVGIAIVVGKIIHYAIKTYAVRFAAKTESKIDDMIIEIGQWPIIFLLLIIGLFIGFKFLTADAALAGIFTGVISALVVLDVAWLLIKLIDAFLKFYLVPLVSKTDSKLDDQLIPVISKITKVAILVLALILILNNAGYDITAVLAGLGIGGLAIAFAAQATISDLFGSFTIFTSKPFIVGDIVELEGTTAKVEQVGLRSTRMRDFDGRLVVMPNSKVAAGKIKNISSEPSRRVVLNLGLTYNTPVAKIKKAKEIVKKVIESQKDATAKDLVLSFTEFKDFSLNLMVIYFIPNADKRWEVMDAVNTGIKEQFEKAGIEFAFPTQTIYLAK
ncbi:MAG: mechanosensitive ion channel family protein [Candidatus Diapherotrites archaeon]